MKICGVVAEYNPFHRGHAFQLRQIRRLLGPDTAIVCCMSGDYVQRGEPAVMSKWARAESAVRCGADLVVELPSPWALQSAEGFARASVGLLAALGCATDLAFGAECPDVDRLQRLAALLLERGVRLTCRIVPGGEHCEASWEKQIPFFIETLMYELNR